MNSNLLLKVLGIQRGAPGSHRPLASGPARQGSAIQDGHGSGQCPQPRSAPLPRGGMRGSPGQDGAATPRLWAGPSPACAPCCPHTEGTPRAQCSHLAGQPWPFCSGPGSRSLAWVVSQCPQALTEGKRVWVPEGGSAMARESQSGNPAQLKGNSREMETFLQYI